MLSFCRPCKTTPKKVFLRLLVSFFSKKDTPIFDAPLVDWPEKVTKLFVYTANMVQTQKVALGPSHGTQEVKPKSLLLKTQAPGDPGVTQGTSTAGDAIHLRPVPKG